MRIDGKIRFLITFASHIILFGALGFSSVGPISITISYVLFNFKNPR